MSDLHNTIVALLKASTPTDALLHWMAANGSSLILNFGEDNNIWECSWIVDGVRYSAFEKTAKQGARQCLLRMAQDKLKMQLEAQC